MDDNYICNPDNTYGNFLPARKNRNLNYTLKSSFLLIMILLYFIAL